MMSDRKSNEEAPLAYVDRRGIIIGFNETFVKLSGRSEREMAKDFNITTLAKLNDRMDILQAVYEIDKLASDERGTWHAFLHIERKDEGKDGQEDGKADDKSGDVFFEILVKPSSMRIPGCTAGIVLEATFQPMTPLNLKRMLGLDNTTIDPSTGQIVQKAERIETKSEREIIESFRNHSFLTQRVLVVEDSVPALKMMKKSLESLGHEVNTANNGLEALQIMKANDFDIVLMDINMPLMNGLEASYAFRQIESQRSGATAHQKIIAMSSDISTSLFHQCSNAGFDAFVPKPLTKMRFQEVLRYLARSSIPETELEN
ncbi:CheY-like superfamily [Ochromonadaceae sp. CCMP2298]|nr:CheY-like superfamily [Ochromonadaceae sp. CCMP2298]